MKNIAFLSFVFILSFAVPALAQSVFKEIVSFGDGENLIQMDKFRPYEDGYELQNGTFFCERTAESKKGRGATQHIVLNQTTPMPLIAEAESKAENVSGSADSEYSIYLDLTYMDGTQLWGQTVAFSVGTHDWEKKQLTLFPEKPVKSLSFYTLFRGKTGKVWFRNPKFSVFKTPEKDGAKAVLFDGVPVVAKDVHKMRDRSQGGFTVQLRDVKNNSPFVIPANSGNSAFGVECNSLLTFKKPVSAEISLALKDPASEDKCLTLVFSIQYPETDAVLRCLRPYKDVPISETKMREHVAPTAYGVNNIGGGRLSREPFFAVAGTKDGKEFGNAIGIDLAYPAFFRTGYNEGTKELFVTVDLALTKESPKANLHFVFYSFDPKEGYRGALAEYQRLYPAFFDMKVKNQGNWMPFAKISKVPQFEDFGFTIKEGNDEVAFDDKHNILTFRYTEPMTWWMRMPEEMPRTYEAGVELAKKMAAEGRAQAKALFSSGIKDADGRYGHRVLDTPWCNGIVWSINDLPGIKDGGFAVNWSDEIYEKFYGEEAKKKGILDGEYVDSAEGYVTSIMDYDREHFSAANFPLVFARDTFRPAIFRGLIVYEYVRKMAEDLHPKGKLTMANSTPSSLCWLVPYVDVAGSEVNWNRSGKWSPMSMDDLFYRRALCGQKPYCFLMNTDFTQWSMECSEKYMKRCLAFGMFPGFFSADASTKQYFTQPELYERDRPLFKKYVPLCQEIANAGWQPLTKVKQDNEKIFVERFSGNGKTYFTVFNASTEPQTAVLRFDGDLPKQWKERLTGKSYFAQNNELTLTVGAEDVLLLSQ
ncbi:MAG: hypothetical protein FWE67_03525 [Planctomycetaceae bacterium]|nr:hypothetical protein [Planctomycetaceae bacterium]